MPDTAPLPDRETSQKMTLAEANDALSDMVRLFHNEMLRRGVKEMTPRQWGEEFRSWFSSYEFEREYRRTLTWLAEAGLRANG